MSIKENQQQTVLERIQACLLGVRIGDALGCPTEMMKHREIIEKTGGKGVCSLEDLHLFQRKLDPGMPYAFGDTSDDWAFTRELAECLIVNNGYHHENCARRFVNLMDGGVMGMGGTTRKSLEEIKDFFDSNGKIGRSYDLPALGDGCGNGVAMRIAPLALYYAVLRKGYDRKSQMNEELLRHGLMTHPDPRASFAGHCIACVICKVLYNPIQNAEDFLDWLLNEMENIEKHFTNRYKMNTKYPNISDQLRMIKNRNLLSNSQFLRKSFEGETSGMIGSFSLESVPFAVGVFLRHPDNLKAGILEAINCGGDTDTIASMAGAMIGANSGLQNIPQEWIGFMGDAYEDTLKLGERFYYGICVF